MKSLPLIRLLACGACTLAVFSTSVLYAQPAAKPLPADHAQRMERGLVQFQKEVAGILKTHCVKCHGGEKSFGDFDLATREGLLKGGGSGPAVVPFHPEESLLYKLVTHADEPKMPEEGPKLSDAKLALLKSWIENGAPYDQPLIAGKKPPRDGSIITEEDRAWWAFQPLKAQPLPTGPQPHPVDRFIAAKAATANLSIPAAADRRTLIRRATLELTGLPPTPEDLEAFERDASPDAWKKLVDRLLDSPHYGERWARHWLDVARFAESAGFEHDYDRPGAWAFRDFVIKALNQDMPFNQFVHWQLAGDEYAPQDPLALSATGFLGAGVFPTQITANEVERTRYDALDDMLSTTGSAFLGLTIGCARCHDHKYDPIPVRDYYRMLSTFTTTVRSNIDVELDPEKAQRDRDAWQAAHAPLVAAVATREAALQIEFAEWLKTGAKLSASASWSVLDLAEIKSQAGAKFKKLDDGSYLAEGPNGAQDTYTLTANTGLKSLTGLRLEALAHPSMKANGPGRAPNGNIGLSKITAAIALKDGSEQPITLTKPQATFEQNKSSLSIAGSLDDNPSTGWAVDPQFGKDHAAVFTFAEPVTLPEGAALKVTLDFRVNGQHNIGRPRLSVIADVEPKLELDTIPAAVAELLTKVNGAKPQPLADAERQTLFDWWKRRDAMWRTLQAKVDTHTEQQPKGTTTILVCAEGYKPMRHHSQGADFFEETYLLDRGSADRKRGVVTPSFLQVLMKTPDQEARWTWTPPEKSQFSGRRRGMAEWLTDVEHGAGALTARVIVNRLWQHHFGTGIVATPNDFGRTGTAPTHPELLDWLASELIRENWKLKPIHRLLMTSATYQQRPAPAHTASSDPGAALFVKRLPQRLEGEALRDSLLAVSGKLDPTMYGPGTKDERSLRRSIYFTMKRSQLIGSMVVYDQPEPLVSQGSRPTTTVAPQALLLMNGPQVRDWAETFAKHVQQQAGTAAQPADWINRAYQVALNRLPTAVERQEAIDFINTQAASYASDAKATTLALALADFCQILFALNEFAYVD